jgi:hypothetical protein
MRCKIRYDKNSDFFCKIFWTKQGLLALGERREKKGQKLALPTTAHGCLSFLQREREEFSHGFLPSDGTSISSSSKKNTILLDL